MINKEKKEESLGLRYDPARVKVYMTPLCPDCVEASKILEENGIEYHYIDITSNTASLKEFLKLRDHREEFKEIREEGKIGIPCFCFKDDSVEFDIEKAKNRMMEE